MTASQITNLRGLLAKATPGPWAITLNQGSIRPLGETRRIAYGHDGNSASRYSDWSLIVAAINALPSLLDAAERVERQTAAIRAYCDAYDAGTDTVYVEPLMRALLAETADGGANV